MFILYICATNILRPVFFEFYEAWPELQHAHAKDPIIAVYSIIVVITLTYLLVLILCMIWQFDVVILLRNDFRFQKTINFKSILSRNTASLVWEHSMIEDRESMSDPTSFLRVSVKRSTLRKNDQTLHPS